MDVSSGGISFTDGAVKSFDMSKVKVCRVAELPPDVFQQVLDAQMLSLEQQYTQAPETSDNPTYAEFAHVVVNGKAVAKIDNHGFVEGSNALSGDLQGAIERADQAAGGRSGPFLAQLRAENIAAQLGGTVVKSTTALTQAAFDAIPQPSAKVDFDAMQRDPKYKELQAARQMGPAVMAHILAQT